MPKIPPKCSCTTPLLYIRRHGEEKGVAWTVNSSHPSFFSRKKNRRKKNTKNSWVFILVLGVGFYAFCVYFLQRYALKSFNYCLYYIQGQSDEFVVAISQKKQNHHDEKIE